MNNAHIIGASGYSGMTLVKLLKKHPKFVLKNLYVSEGSADKGKLFSDLYPQFHSIVDCPLLGFDHIELNKVNQGDFFFLATPAEVSHELVAQLRDKGAKVLDLSGAYRLSNKEKFESFNGFAHQHMELQQQSVYGLAEWNHELIANANIVSVPGCYPTASQLALKPLVVSGLLKSGTKPVINAVSGVSGAGRKASLSTSFCELSLKPYGVFGHRHLPEIEEHLDISVVFTPHVANFASGILATITAELDEGVTGEDVKQSFIKAYSEHSLIRLKQQWPQISDVVGTPFCDLCIEKDPNSNQVIVVSAIDNLNKGAASQAIQCANIMCGFDGSLGLLGARHE